LTSSLHLKGLGEMPGPHSSA